MLTSSEGISFRSFSSFKQLWNATVSFWIQMFQLYFHPWSYFVFSTCSDLDVLSAEHISFTDSSPAFQLKLYFINMDSGDFSFFFFFPQVCWSFILKADLGSLSAQALIDSQWSIAKQHGRRCWCCISEIWAAILLRSWSKWRPWPGEWERVRGGGWRGFSHLQINEPVYRSC